MRGSVAGSAIQDVVPDLLEALHCLSPSPSIPPSAATDLRHIRVLIISIIILIIICIEEIVSVTITATASPSVRLQGSAKCVSSVLQSVPCAYACDLAASLLVSSVEGKLLLRSECWSTPPCPCPCRALHDTARHDTVERRGIRQAAE